MGRRHDGANSCCVFISAEKLSSMILPPIAEGPCLPYLPTVPTYSRTRQPADRGMGGWGPIQPLGAKYLYFHI